MLDPRSRRSTEPFLVFDENRLAFEALARLLAKKSSPSSRLVYLYGAAGIGKSHMIQRAILDAALDTRTDYLRMTAAQFAQDFAEALDATQIERFQERHRSSGILICEDMQALTGRRAPQIELEHTIDQVLAHGGRVIVSAVTLPGQLGDFEPRLINRLHGGLCAQVKLPSRSTRLQLLTHFAERKQVPVGADVLSMLADQPLTPSELLASILRLDAESSLPKVTESQLDAARRLVSEQSLDHRPTVAGIAKAVGRQFSVTLTELRASTRARSVVLPRQCAMFLARQFTESPLSEIAKYFGRRNHSTVLHACTKIESAINEDAGLRKQINEIITGLRS